MIRVPYIAHIPFVLVFLGFVLCFVITQAVSRRR
jgi:uncharacterized membrane protein